MNRPSGILEMPSGKMCRNRTGWTSRSLLWTNYEEIKSWNGRITPYIRRMKEVGGEARRRNDKFLPRTLQSTLDKDLTLVTGMGK